MLGLFCLLLNTIGRSGHVRSTIRRDNLLGFKSFVLVMAIGGRPKPELCFLPGRLR